MGLTGGNCEFGEVHFTILLSFNSGVSIRFAPSIVVMIIMTVDPRNLDGFENLEFL